MEVTIPTIGTLCCPVEGFDKAPTRYGCYYLEYVGGGDWHSMKIHNMRFLGEPSFFTASLETIIDRVS